MPVIRRVPQDYASVAAAHSAATSGDIIYITGQYSEIITVTKAVHFVGAGGLTDAVFSSSTANGVLLNNVSFGALNYNLSADEAAKVPFLLVENLYIHNANTNAASVNNCCIRLLGTAPVNGLVCNRCLLTRPTSNNIFGVVEGSWTITMERVTATRSTSGPLGVYGVSLLLGSISGSLLTPELQSTDLLQNWQEKDYVTTPTTGYGVVPTDGITLRWEDLDFEAYRIYGTVTDIPTFVNPTDFEIRLYPEKTPQGNDMGFAPIEMIPLSLIETVDDKWSGSWEFNYLLPTRRYGILINPPDGMQGHWLRWYNPAVE